MIYLRDANFESHLRPVVNRVRRGVLFSVSSSRDHHCDGHQNICSRLRPRFRWTVNA
jgi:hypothetical protein